MISPGDIAWFRPLGRRIALIAVCLAWVVFELVTQHDRLWLTLSILSTVYAVWLSLKVQRSLKEDGEAPER